MNKDKYICVISILIDDAIVLFQWYLIFYHTTTKLLSVG